MSDLARLRLVLALFFVALAIPTAALIHQAYQRLQWESFHQHQGLAEEFATRVEQRIDEFMAVEHARPFTEYSYFNLVSPLSTTVLQRSPLASLPPANAVPGLIGHFQVDGQGQLSLPFQPPPDSSELQSGLTDTERRERDALATRLHGILASNRLLGGAPALKNDQVDAVASDTPRVGEQAAAPTPARRDSAAKALGRVADLKLEQNFQGAPVMAEAAPAMADKRAATDASRALRKEQGALPMLAEEHKRKQGGARQRLADATPIHTFESEVERFESSLLASGELVLFRNVWRDGRRYVQGLVIDREVFLRELVGTPFRLGQLARSSGLVVARHGDVLLRDDGDAARGYGSAPDLRGTLLYQSRLPAPFSDLELIFSVTELPAGPGARVIGWLAALLSLVLGGGLWLALRLGTRQIALARQQQDFIAAVSHELKTPLTSIRMYGEMLREGWAPDAKRQEYYQFIHDEAERLTRLINNVLNLARMTRNELKVEMREVTAAELLDVLRSKLESVVKHAGRRYTLDCPAELASARLRVDIDCFTQVMLNLVDNALKFTSGDEPLQVAVRSGNGSHV
jgi:two-component system phosphate regulon sensor histidine kinase PhoR